MQIFVWPSSLKHHLDIVLVLSEIRGVLFHIDHGSGLLKWIIWVFLWGPKSESLILVEFPSEIVTVNYAEDTTVDIKV